MFWIDGVAGFLTSLFGVGMFSSIIALVALFTYFFGFLRRTRSLARSIEQANQELQSFEGAASFASGFESFDTSIRKNTLLSNIWHEFRETLIFPKPEEQRQVIRNSQEASFFFNEHSIIHPRINLTFYNTFPNYLTGAGILGTFIGLVFGIYLAHKGLDPGMSKR